jgi:predicted RNA-binding Zn-ribbon protein involved in translation (DUF1610 family)
MRRRHPCEEAMTETREPETICGTMYTHWDCPSCGLAHEIEGDADGERTKCDHCGQEVVIRRF